MTQTKTGSTFYLSSLSNMLDLMCRTSVHSLMYFDCTNMNVSMTMSEYKCECECECDYDFGYDHERECKWVVLQKLSHFKCMKF